jgi:putative transposase
MVFSWHCLPCAETVAMLFWALFASGQIIMRKVDGWRSLRRSHN